MDVANEHDPENLKEAQKLLEKEDEFESIKATIKELT